MPGGRTILFVRDNATELAATEGFAADGISLGIFPSLADTFNSNAVSISLALRNSLSDIIDGRSIPTDFDTGLLDGEVNQFVAEIDGNTGIRRVTGFSDVSQVPSPATIGLFEIPLFLLAKVIVGLDFNVIGLRSVATS